MTGYRVVIFSEGETTTERGLDGLKAGELCGLLVRQMEEGDVDGFTCFVEDGETRVEEAAMN